MLTGNGALPAFTGRRAAVGAGPPPKGVGNRDCACSGGRWARTSSRCPEIGQLSTELDTGPLLTSSAVRPIRRITRVDTGPWRSTVLCASWGSRWQARCWGGSAVIGGLAESLPGRHRTLRRAACDGHGPQRHARHRERSMARAEKSPRTRFPTLKPKKY